MMSSMNRGPCGAGNIAVSVFFMARTPNDLSFFTFYSSFVRYFMVCLLSFCSISGNL